LFNFLLSICPSTVNCSRCMTNSPSRRGSSFSRAIWSPGEVPTTLLAGKDGNMALFLGFQNNHAIFAHRQSTRVSLMLMTSLSRTLSKCFISIAVCLLKHDLFLLARIRCSRDIHVFRKPSFFRTCTYNK